MDAVASPLDHYRELLRQANISPEKPLHPVLLTAYETALMASEAVKGGARGLTPEAERELVFRVAENAATATGREVERLSRRAGWRNALLMALAGLALVAGGYAWGERHRAGFLAEVEALNDAAGIEQICRQHVFRRDGRTACQLPPVWIKGALE